jgi:hypothetical protein
MGDAGADIKSFWNWFREHAGRWKKPGPDFDEQRFIEVYDGIANTFPALTPTTSYTPGGGYELVFSLTRNRDPEARKKAAPLIRALVRAAPKMKTWRIIAFAERVGWMDAFLPRLDFPDDSRLPVSKLRFDLLGRKPPSLRVYVPKYTKKHEAHFLIAVERVLEAGMGEAWVLEELGHLELADLESASKSAKAIVKLDALRA